MRGLTYGLKVTVSIMSLNLHSNMHTKKEEFKSVSPYKSIFFPILDRRKYHGFVCAVANRIGNTTNKDLVAGFCV